MKIKGAVAGVLLAGGVVFATRGCLSTASRAPDERVAKRLGDICDIARDNVKTPEKGVRKLGGYLDKNVDKLLADYGAMFAAIERIPDDKRHDDRARLARDRLRKAACESDMQRFAEAIKADPKASALLERFAERFSRTLEIISGERQSIDFSRLPALDQLFVR
ncbi:MAG TPA: hypothetical protein VL326_06475 [Kofleriaceae bacterium]|jgi:hypothetical protein|nr:hypothetical protein [Kofleriaceae bacterium]